MLRLVTRRRTASIVYLVALAQGLVGAAFPASAVVLRESGLGDVRYGSLFVPQMALARSARAPPATSSAASGRAARSCWGSC